MPASTRAAGTGQKCQQDVGISHLVIHLGGDLLGIRAVLLEILGAVLELLTGLAHPFNSYDLSRLVERFSSLDQ